MLRVEYGYDTGESLAAAQKPGFTPSGDLVVGSSGAVRPKLDLSSRTSSATGYVRVAADRSPGRHRPGRAVAEVGWSAPSGGLPRRLTHRNDNPPAANAEPH